MQESTLLLDRYLLQEAEANKLDMELEELEDRIAPTCECAMCEPWLAQGTDG